MAKGKHLGFRERILIQTEIDHNYSSSLSSIAKLIGFDASTVFRELKGNAQVYKSSQESFQHSTSLACSLLSKFPFCCNLCKHIHRCSRRIVRYDAYEAEAGSKNESRIAHQHPRCSTKELQRLNQVISPRVLLGQSLYHIKTTDSSITKSESTIRRYIGHAYLMARNIDLPRTVQHKLVGKKIYDHHRKRVDVAILRNRLYEDFKAHLAIYPSSVILELDTVFGSRGDHKCLFTLFERKSRFQWAYLVNQSQDSINFHLRKMMEQLLEETNGLFFDTIIVDNGSEFEGIPLLEFDEFAVFRFRSFFCNPYNSGQKGGCERNHEFIRYVYKKGASIEGLSQDSINELCSQFNSLRRKSLNGFSSYQVFTKLYGALTPKVLGIEGIDPSKIILRRKKK